MKWSMLCSKFLVFAILYFLVNSCSKNEDIITYDLTGSWKVISFLEDGKTITKTPENTWLDINKGDITITFEEVDDNGEGRFSGINVTNGFTGHYILKEEGKITMGAVATTLINEPEWAKLFKITNAQRYEVRNAQLIIYRENTNNTITLVRD